MTARKSIFRSRSARNPGSKQHRAHERRLRVPKTFGLRGFTFALAMAALFGFISALSATSKTSDREYGLTAHAPSQPYLRMPQSAAGKIPRVLSETGAFKNTGTFQPADNLIPYDLAVPFWSDGASKTRWVSIPNKKVGFAKTGEWKFPSGTVFIKTFEVSIDNSNPAKKRRLETRLLVRDAADGVYGVTYKWRENNEDADLLETNLTEAVLIRTSTGVRTQMWYYPSRADCLTCHTKLNGGVLGPKTRQLNCDFTYPGNTEDNQLRTWNHLGLFDATLDDSEFSRLPSLAGANDKSRSIEDRARSYLDANCAHCHRPGGTVAYFDARYDTPLGQQNLINGQVLIDQRIDRPRIIAPNDIWRSILYLRVNTAEPFKMPPLAHNLVDESGVKTLREWIESLPGPPVLRPPEILPAGGTFKTAVKMTINSEPDAEIHYTIDGTVPTKSDPVYNAPVEVQVPAIVRARAFKDGYTRSITSQQIYLADR